MLHFSGTGISGVREGDGGDELVIKVPGSAGSVLESKVWSGRESKKKKTEPRVTQHLAPTRSESQGTR